MAVDCLHLFPARVRCGARVCAARPAVDCRRRAWTQPDTAGVAPAHQDLSQRGRTARFVYQLLRGIISQQDVRCRLRFVAPQQRPRALSLV